MRIVPAALCAAFFVLAIQGMPRPADANRCVPPGEVARQVLNADPEARIARIEGELADRLSRAIVRQTAMRMSGEALYLVISTGGRSYNVVARFQEGCLSHHGRFPAALIRRWLEGEPA